MAGESTLFVDPAEIPADADIARLGQALAAGRHGDRDELMAGRNGTMRHTAARLLAWPR